MTFAFKYFFSFRIPEKDPYSDRRVLRFACQGSGNGKHSRYKENRAARCNGGYFLVSKIKFPMGRRFIVRSLLVLYEYYPSEGILSLGGRINQMGACTTGEKSESEIGLIFYGVGSKLKRDRRKIIGRATGWFSNA